MVFYVWLCNLWGWLYLVGVDNLIRTVRFRINSTISTFTTWVLARIRFLLSDCIITRMITKGHLNLLFFRFIFSECIITRYFFRRVLFFFVFFKIKTKLFIVLTNFLLLFELWIGFLISIDSKFKVWVVLWSYLSFTWCIKKNFRRIITSLCWVWHITNNSLGLTNSTSSW